MFGHIKSRELVVLSYIKLCCWGNEAVEIDEAKVLPRLQVKRTKKTPKEVKNTIDEPKDIKPKHHTPKTKHKVRHTYIPSHERTTKENFTCYYCNRKFKTKQVVRSHVNTNTICYDKHEERKKKHPGAKQIKEDQDLIDSYPIKCKYCNMGQPTKGALYTHVNYYHLKDKKKK